MIDTAIILAGGLGTRLKATVPNVPKPMAPINHKPFLEHQINYWYQQGIQNFMLSVGYQQQIIKDYFGTRYQQATIQYASEETPLGTGGGLLLAAQLLQTDNSVLVLNGDTYFDINLTDLYHFHCEKAADWTFALCKAPYNPRYMSIATDGSGKIFSFNENYHPENKTHIDEMAINSGVYIIKKSILKTQNNYTSEPTLSLENELLPQLQQQGIQFFGLLTKGDFIDIGLPDDYHRAHQIIST